MADENICELTGGDNTFVESDGGTAALEDPPLHAPIPSGSDDCILGDSNLGAGIGHFKSCGLSLDSSDRLEAFSDTIKRRIHFKKLGSVVGERRKGISQWPTEEVKGSSTRVAVTIPKPSRLSSRSEEPAEGKGAATSQEGMNSGEEKNLSKSPISGGGDIGSPRDRKKMQRHCSKTRMPCNCTCKECCLDRWGELTPPCTCPLLVKRSIGLDFAVRQQRLYCKCRWMKGRVLPNWMCKCKTRDTSVLRQRWTIYDV